jgi:PcaR/PcaU/PobR family beta-ketoadipate pathway transcriptional regulator
MKLVRVKADKEGSRYNIETLARGLNILELFTQKTPCLSLTEITGSLKLSKSTVFRILATLESSGYLDRDPATRRYRPSLKVLQLGFLAINRLEVRQVARPYLERLSQEVNETVSLCVLHGSDIVYVDRIRNRAIVGVVLDIGSHVPAHSTTVGKILLAYLPPGELRRRLGETKLERYTSRTITDGDALLAQLSGIREDGYAISDGELAVGLRAVGAPIRDMSNDVVAAINVSGSQGTISLQRLRKELLPAVVRTANQISLALGYIARGEGTAPGTAGSWE